MCGATGGTVTTEEQMIYTCDRCQKQFAYESHIDAIWRQTSAESFYAESIKLDLCSNCMCLLYKFLHGTPAMLGIVFPKDDKSDKPN